MDKMPTMEEIREEVRTSPEHAEFRKNFKIDAVLGSVFMLSGFAAIAVYSHWLVAAGVFAVFWGQNVLRQAGRRPEKKKEN